MGEGIGVSVEGSVAGTCVDVDALGNSCFAGIRTTIVVAGRCWVAAGIVVSVGPLPRELRITKKMAKKAMGARM